MASFFVGAKLQAAIGKQSKAAITGYNKGIQLLAARGLALWFNQNALRS